MSGHKTQEQPPPPTTFSFGELHSPKNSPDLHTSPSLRYTPNPNLNQKKHVQSSQFKGKGKANGEPRNPRMGKLLQKEDHSNLRHHYRRDQSNPNSHHGLVRGGTEESLESHISAHLENLDERLPYTIGPSLVQLAQPMVELLVRQNVKKGESDSGLEGASLKIKGANLGRLKPTRHTHGRENVGG